MKTPRLMQTVLLTLMVFLLPKTLWGACIKTDYRDDFNTASLNNNDGGVNWDTPWIETDVLGAGASSGGITMSGGKLVISRVGFGSQPAELVREMNFSQATTMDWYFQSANLYNNSEDVFYFQISYDSGSNWQTLASESGLYTAYAKGRVGRPVPSSNRVDNVLLRIYIPDGAFEDPGDYMDLDYVRFVIDCVDPSLAPTPTPTPPPTPQKLLHYPFENQGTFTWDGTIDEIEDSSSFNAHSQGMQGVAPDVGFPVIPGSNGTCAYATFDGHDDYIKTQDSATNLQISGSYTVAFWIYAEPDQKNNVGFYYFTPPSESTTYWGLRYDSFADDIFLEHDGSAFNTGINWSQLTNQWRHIAITYNGSDASSYLDGNLVNTNTMSNSPIAALGHLKIGTDRSGSSSFAFKGKIDEFMVFDQDLDLAEINTLYNEVHACGSIPSTSDPLLHYEFEDAAYNGLADEVRDTMANYHGYAVGNNVSVQSSSPAVSSVPGTCSYIELDGSADHLTTNNNDLSQQMTSGEYTVSFWVQWLSNASWDTPIQIKNGSNPHVFMLRDNENTATNGDLFIVHDHSDITKGIDSGLRIPSLIGNWHHIAITFKETTSKTYLDGKLLRNTIYIRTVNSMLAQFMTGEFVHGHMDDVKVFNQALNDADIANLSTGHLQCAEKILEYKFESSSWNGSISEVVDSSSSNQHAFTVNGVQPNNIDPVFPGNPGSCNYPVFLNNNQYIISSDAPQAAPLNDAYTLMFWVNASNTQNDDSAPFSIVNSTDNLNYVALVKDGNQDVYVLEHDIPGDGLPADRINIGIRPSDVTGGWHHIALTYRNGYFKSFLDGVLVQAAAIDPIQVNSGFIKLGTDHSNGPINAFNGAMDEVKLFDEVLSLADIQSHRTAIHACTAPIVTLDHFEISSSSVGSTCAPNSITIRACATADCSSLFTDYSGTINLSTSTLHGDWREDTSNPLNGTLTDSASDDGLAAYQFHPNDLGQIELLFENNHADDLQIQARDFVYGITDLSSSLSFRDNIFDITVAPDLIAGKPLNVSATLYASDAGQCAIATNYDGLKDVSLWISRGTHLTTSQPPSLNGVDLPSTLPTASNVQLNFNNGVANFSLDTRDVGEYSLHLKDESGFALNGTIHRDVMGQTTPLILPPFAFSLNTSADANTANALATNHLSSVFKAAGEDFILTIQAVGWQASDDTDNNGVADTGANLADNLVLPSFGQEATPETVDVTHALKLPTGGDPGNLLSGNAVSGFSMGETQATLQYSEVGIIDLQVNLSDNNYLSTGNDVVGSVENIGRFTPAYFSISSPNVGHGCIVGQFTYLGQDLGLWWNMEARNTLGNITRNYDGQFMKLNTSNSNDFNISYLQPSPFFDLTSRLNVQSWSSSMNTGEGNALISFRIDRLASPEPVYQAQMGIAPQDSDGITLNTFDLDVDFDLVPDHLSLGISPLRYGRVMVENASGPGNQTLETDIYIQHYETLGFNQDFVNSTDDDCTVLNNSHLSLSNYTEELSSGETTASINHWSTGNGTVSFSKPGDSNNGSVTLNVTVPNWLEYDYDGSGITNPNATIGFGIYNNKRSNVIFVRELVR